MTLLDKSTHSVLSSALSSHSSARFVDRHPNKQADDATGTVLLSQRNAGKDIEQSWVMNEVLSKDLGRYPLELT